MLQRLFSFKGGVKPQTNKSPSVREAIGFAPLPETFWTRSMITKPADREVVCHASAWERNKQRSPV